MVFKSINKLLIYLIEPHSRTAVAEKVGVSHQYLTDLVTQRRPVKEVSRPESLAIRLANLLGYDLEIVREYKLTPKGRPGRTSPRPSGGETIEGL